MSIKLHKVIHCLEVGIWWVQKRYPQYVIPIWCLWPNIRFLPLTVTEKNVTKNILDGRKYGRTDRGKTVYPPHSYFLFADLVGFYTHWTYMHIFRHIFFSNYWWQRSDIWSQASYRYPISWEAFLDPSDCFPQYGVPIWSLWPNIRFLPSIVAEKNATKNEHICSMCIKINKVFPWLQSSDYCIFQPWRVTRTYCFHRHRSFSTGC
jgi:hypothetical protein